MKLLELIPIINKYVNADILAENRQRHNVYAKKLFCKLGYEMDVKVRQQHIADILGCNHDLVLYHKKTFDIVEDEYKIAFNELIELYDLDVKMVQVKSQKEVKPVMSDVQLALLNDLKQLSDNDILEFRETRLKPYISMLKSRKRPMQRVEVAGALLRS